jgi:hypothetical protein
LPGWGAKPGPLNFIYFLIFHHFTTEPQRLPLFKKAFYEIVCLYSDDSMEGSFDGRYIGVDW